jgi:hypothetical protein
VCDDEILGGKWFSRINVGEYVTALFCPLLPFHVSKQPCALCETYPNHYSMEEVAVEVYTLGRVHFLPFMIVIKYLTLLIFEIIIIHNEMRLVHIDRK